MEKYDTDFDHLCCVLQSSIHVAARYGRVEMIQILVNAKGDVDIKSKSSRAEVNRDCFVCLSIDLQTALILIGRTTPLNLPVLRALINVKADPNVQNAWKWVILARVCDEHLCSCNVDRASLGNWHSEYRRS